MPPNALDLQGTGLRFTRNSGGGYDAQRIDGAFRQTLGRRLLDGYPYLRAEVAYAVTHEGALHPEDVLARRVRLLLESSDAGLAAAPEVVAIMAGLLGWNRRRRAAELRRYQDFASVNAAALRVPAELPEAPAAMPVPA